MQVFFIISFLSILSNGRCQVKQGSVLYSNGNYTYTDTIQNGSLAYGSFNDSVETTGWGVLDITATRHDKYTPEQIMYAAGILEGAFTSERIYQHYQNLGGFLFDNEPAETREKMCLFLDAQEKWMRSKAAVGGKWSTLWRFAGYILNHIDGLYHGYMLTAQKNMTKCDLQILNAVGDIIDLRHVFTRRSMAFFKKMSREALRRYAQRSGHCSALIKVTPGYENMYMAHDSWFVYSSMLRIFKHYDFDVFENPSPNSKMSFSSYPGFLSSLDDFYILGSRMVVLQTTNNIYNTSLYDLVVPESLLAWHRVRIANLVANSGAEWGDIIKMYNSGTYNNQYMVVDLKRFTPQRGFEHGALYIVEQIPGLVESHDQTHILENGYWASYNVPFYESIYNISGYAAVAAHNPDNSHELAPRAKIFRRDQGNVTDMRGMKMIMRSNDYTHDKYSEQDPCNAICCRADLQNMPSNMGCYDTKVTDFFIAQNFTSYAVSGPTVHGKSSLPPFVWKPYMKHHLGMPNKYDFPFVTMRPKYF